MQVINQQIRAFLATAPSEAALTDFINNLVPKITPKVKLHELDLKATKEPTLVYAKIMVQDIRDPFFYYSFIMKRPFAIDDKFYLFRWGNHPQIQNVEQVIQSNHYMKVMLERDQVQCVPVIGLTSWAKKLEGEIEPIQLFVDGKSDFKLGEVVNIVAFYYPDHGKMYYVRRATQEEIIQEHLNPLEQLKNGEVNVDHSKTRQELLSFFSNYCSQNFAEYLLLCLLSETPLFLGAEADVSELISLVYPRVKHLKLVHPCQESLFPFKNEDGEMKIAPMQLSNLATFVSIDLAAFSDKNIVQIGENTINNFKALKVFVEEANTIYRWEYGESFVSHSHKGIIVKASSFLTPHFNPKDQAISPDFSTLKNISSETLDKFRAYLIAVMSVVPKLEQQQRSKIEQFLKTQPQKAFIGSKLNGIMQLSMLIARSHGRESILFVDYQRAKFLVQNQVPQKKQN